jgi:acetyl-CoA carboxylase biotin carboxyl carrier protein
MIMSPSIDEVREVLKIFLDSNLQDLKLEIGSVRLAVTKNGAASGAVQPFNSRTPAVAAQPLTFSAPEPQAIATPAAAPITPPAKSAAAPGEGWTTITAPSVGIFYRRPAPDQPSFVEVGSAVEANDPICLIEVMKLFTGVAAPCKGCIAEILVEDSTMVEYGQPLMYIRPA